MDTLAMRISGANDTIDVYSNMLQVNGRLSEQQKTHIKEVMCICNQQFYELANELLKS